MASPTSLAAAAANGRGLVDNSVGGTALGAAAAVPTTPPRSRWPGESCCCDNPCAFSSSPYKLARTHSVT
jgi:hypothetical protein